MVEPSALNFRTKAWPANVLPAMYALPASVRAQLQDESMARECLTRNVRAARCIHGDGGRSGHGLREISGVKKLAAIRCDHGGEHLGAGAGPDRRAGSGGKLAARGTSERDVSIGIDGECGSVVRGWAAEQRPPTLVAGRVDFDHRRIGTGLDAGPPVETTRPTDAQAASR